MPQASLFTADLQVLTDDARGRIAYEPGFVDRATARAWFEEIRERAPWRRSADRCTTARWTSPA